MCDGFDNDCDYTSDEGVIVTYYADDDGDQYGDYFVATGAVGMCEPPAGFT